MPMDFPDFDSLKRHAARRHFRKPDADETEKEYRVAFSEYLRPIDPVESQEVLFGKGWDRWSETEKMLSLFNLMKK